MQYLHTLIVFSITFSLINQTLCGFKETDNTPLSRQKRFLVWKRGFNWVQFVAGIGLPSEVKDQSITLGSVVKAFYLLPDNSTWYTMPTIDFLRRKRSASASRWALYSVFEKFIEGFGYGDGKACMLRTICEAASIPFDSKSGLMAEIAHALLTPSSTSEAVENNSDNEYHSAERLGKEVNKCDLLFPDCDVNILKTFSKFLS